MHSIPTNQELSKEVHKQELNLKKSNYIVFYINI